MNNIIPPTPTTANPLQLMEKQVRLLTDLCTQQDRARTELLQELAQLRSERALQTEKIVTAIKAGRTVPNTLSAAQEVEVTNFNMPYLSLVGFLFKLWLAHLPVIVVVAIIWAVVFAVVGGGLLSLLVRPLQ